jgi:O-antigen ligase
VVIFVGYPSATTAAVGVVIVLTLYMTQPSASPRRPLFFAAAAFVVVAVVALNFGTIVHLSDRYFTAVGKQNNNGGRLAEWSGGIEKWKESPIYGSVFSGGTTVFVIRRGGLGAPLKGSYNSDYIEFLVLGGAIGLALLLSWYVTTEATVIKRYRAFLEAGQRNHAMLLRALLVGFNAFLTAGLFNPLYNGASRSATVFALYGLMMAVGGPERTSEEVPVPTGRAAAQRRQFDRPLIPA